MTELTTENLSLLNSQGWILAPKETAIHFFSRKKITEEKREDLPLSKNFPSEAHDITERLYQFRLEGVPIFYANNSLSLWEGAILWSYHEKGKDPFPVIQMRTNYKKGLLRLYSEKEILAHELVHAARFAFKEPLFEELLAYKTSSNHFYSFLGPLFIFRMESLLFVLLTLGSVLGFIFLDWGPLLWLPSFFFACLFFRLLILHLLFSLAKSHLQKAGVASPLALLLRLSDKEIILSALSNPNKIKKKLLSSKDLRLKKIIPSYFGN